MTKPEKRKPFRHVLPKVEVLKVRPGRPKTVRANEERKQEEQRKEEPCSSSS